MKRKNPFIIFFLISFLIGIISLLSCKKANELVQDTYTVKLAEFENDTISSNPVIAWSINPLPPGDLKSTLRIAKITEGESPESALEKNGTDHNTCNTSLIQYLDNPVLDANANYAFQVTVTDNLKSGGFQIISAIAIHHVTDAPRPRDFFKTVTFGTNSNNFYVIEFTPTYSNFYPGEIEYKVIKIKPCPIYLSDGWVEQGNIHWAGSQPVCEWDLVANREQAIIDALPGNTLPDPVLLETGTFPMTAAGPFMIQTQVEYSGGLCSGIGYLIYLKSIENNHSQTFYYR